MNVRSWDQLVQNRSTPALARDSAAAAGLSRRANAAIEQVTAAVGRSTAVGLLSCTGQWDATTKTAFVCYASAATGLRCCAGTATEHAAAAITDRAALRA